MAAMIRGGSNKKATWYSNHLQVETVRVYKEITLSDMYFQLTQGF